MARVAVAGYVGGGNLGDEAVLAGTIRLLAEVPVEAVAVSRRPEETRALHGVDAVHWLDLPALDRLFRSVDAVLLGGGSLLQDRTSLRSLLYYLALSDLAARRTRTVWWAMGIGPFHRRLSRQLVARAGRHAARITVRDEASRSLLVQLGLTAAAVIPDPAFLLETPVAPHPRARRVAVLARPLPNAPSFPRWLAAELRAFTAEGGEVWLLPLQRGEDERLAADLAADVPSARLLPRPASPDAVLATLAACDGVLSVRLHGLILAAVAGRPALAIPYDPKVDAHAALLSLPSVAPGEPLAARLTDLLAADAPSLAAIRAAIRSGFAAEVAPLLAS